LKSALKVIAVMALFSLLPGCVYINPTRHTFENSRIYQKGFDPIWDHAVQYFSERKMAPTTIDKARGVIHVEKADIDPDEIADCGTGGVFSILGTDAAIGVLVFAAGDRTKVTVITNFEQRREEGGHVRIDRCTSTGRLEQEILNSL
jgi:hypothetical protein